MVKRQYITVIATALLLASCSSFDDFVANDESVTPLQIGEVTTYNDGSGVQSRAVIEGTTAITSGDIGLFLTDYGRYKSSWSNVKYSNSGSGWAVATGFDPITLSDSLATIYAYYPYDAGVVTDQKIPLTASYNGSDVCYGKASNLTHTACTATFSMNHAMTRIDVKVAKGAAYGGNAKTQSIKLSGTNVCGGSGSLNALNGVVTATASDFELTGLTVAAGTAITCLLVPVTSTAADVTLNLGVDQADYNCTATLSGLKLISGAKYDVAVTVTGAGVISASVSQGTWSFADSTYTINGHKVMLKGTTTGIAFNTTKDDNNVYVIASPTVNETSVTAPACTFVSGGAAVTGASSAVKNGVCTTTIPVASLTADIYVTYSGAPYISNTNGHNGYVTIGDLKWATMDVGATNECTDVGSHGDYFAYGEVESYVNLSSATRYTTGVHTQDLSGYFKTYAIGKCYHSVKTSYDWPNYCGTTGFTEWTDKPYDGNGNLKPEYDAARVAWGGTWRTPTEKDWRALFSACGFVNTGGNYCYLTSTIAASTTADPAKGIHFINASSGTISLNSKKSISVSGILFVADASDASKWLFCPSSGWVSGKNVNNEGQNMVSASATVNASSKSKYCDYTGSKIGIVSTVAADRTFGFVIRPVSY